MKIFIAEFLQFFGDIFKTLFVVFFVFAVFFLYHVMLNFSADLIGWEGTAIFVSILSLVVGIFVGGTDKLNKEYDEVYAESRIKGLEDELKDREVYIIRLCDKIDKQDDLMQNLGVSVDQQVTPKIADITKFISDWGCLDATPEGKYEQIEDKTLRRLIKAIERNFVRG